MGMLKIKVAVILGTAIHLVFGNCFSTNSTKQSVSSNHLVANPSSDTVYLNEIPVYGDSSLILANHPYLSCYKSKIDVDIGYPDYSLDCIGDSTNVNLLIYNNTQWIYEFYTMSTGSSVTVSGRSFYIGEQSIDIYRRDSLMFERQVKSNLNFKSYDRVPQLRYIFDVPVYLNTNEKQGEVILQFKEGTLKKISVNFYLESLFD